MVVAMLVLCASLTSSPASTVASDATYDAAALVGIWELTGVGDQREWVSPGKVMIELTAAGIFKMSVWEEDEPRPFVVDGRYGVTKDALELEPRLPSQRSQTYSFSWEGTVLVLEPLPEEPNAVSLRFERRPLP